MLLALLSLTAAAQPVWPPPLEPAAPPPVAAHDAAPADPPSEHVWVRLCTEAPETFLNRARGRLVAAGGVVTAESRSADGDGSLEVAVPAARWPEVEPWLLSLDVETLERERVGAPRGVVVALDASDCRWEEEPNFHIGPTVGVLVPAGVSAAGPTRPIGGVNVQVGRNVGLDVAYARPQGGLPWHLRMSLGLRTFSEYLGAGERTFLNPWLGLRLGYAYQDTSWFVTHGEVGLELYRGRYLVVESWARPGAWLKKGDARLSLEAGGGVSLPF